VREKGTPARSPTEREAEAERTLEVESILRVRIGHGANCSSIGSVIDTLFATATVGAALFAAVIAALKAEDVSVVSPRVDREGTRGDARGSPAPEKGP
jgi:hypothetical protein